jgi:hypothetical protein
LNDQNNHQNVCPHQIALSACDNKNAVARILVTLMSGRNALSIQLAVFRAEPECKVKHWLGAQKLEAEEDAVMQEMDEAIKRLTSRRWMEQTSMMSLLEVRTMMNSSPLMPKKNRNPHESQCSRQ